MSHPALAAMASVSNQVMRRSSFSINQSYPTLREAALPDFWVEPRGSTDRCRLSLLFDELEHAELILQLVDPTFLVFDQLGFRLIAPQEMMEHLFS